MHYLVLLGFLSAAVASDAPCNRLGGTCLDYRSSVSIAGYARGLCAGDTNRRCKLPCGYSCQQSEKSYAKKDGKCHSIGGKCFYSTNYCSGSFVSGKCGGPTPRKCCKPATEDCYGNIMNVDTTGASCSTAKQDKLSYCGVPASRKMAEADKARVDKYKTTIVQVAKKKCIDAAIIAAIMSRETRGGGVLRSDGFGYDGHGFGVMQVDDRFHTLAAGAGPFSFAHIEQGTGILISKIGQIKAKHPSWTKDMVLKGGISAYNAGAGNVQSYDRMDIGTTGDDYANDVVARAQYYTEYGY